MFILYWNTGLQFGLRVDNKIFLTGTFSFPSSQFKECHPVRQYKNFQIEVTPNGFCLHGTDTIRPSLRELLEHLEGQSLRTDNLQFHLTRCCPPQPRGKLKTLEI